MAEALNLVNLEDLALSSIDAKALAARNGGVAEYSLAVHGWFTEPHQEAWWEALQTENRLVIVCPPDTRKSATVQCFVEQAIGLNPDIRILWLMATGNQASERVTDVGITIQTNEVYKKAFNIEPDYDRKWTQNTLYVKRNRAGPDPTLMGCGLNGPYQGKHFDIIVIDDPTDQEDVFSDVTMMRQRAKIRGVIIDRLDGPNSRLVGIMTRWSEEDLIPTFAEMGFRIVVMPVMASYPWGPTISDKIYPVEMIPHLRREKTDAIFDLTFMCNPSAVDGGIIKHIKYFDKDMLPTTACINIMAVDPASSTKTWADPSCIGTGVVDIKSRRLYVVDLWTGRVELPELETELIKRAQRLAPRPVAIGLETIGFQATFLQRLRREYRLPFTELPYTSRRQSTHKPRGLDKDKTGRAISIEHGFINDQIYLAKDLPYADGVSVESELKSFPFGKHDDRLDVIAFLHALANTYTGPKQLFSFSRN